MAKDLKLPEYSLGWRERHFAFGAASFALFDMVFNQTWRKWGIPIQSGVPGYSSSKKIDFQSGYERAMSSLVVALSGDSTVQLHGCIHGELTANPVMLVLDDDIAGMVGRIINGVLVNDETLAIDLIELLDRFRGYTWPRHTPESGGSRSSLYPKWRTGCPTLSGWKGGKRTPLTMPKT